jgi:AmiR/NasT family two-component response regulator
MRLRGQAIGAMSLYSTQPTELSRATAELGQALADVATIGILHERAVRRHEVVIEQLQKALDSRITIEQAKGVLAERLHVTIDEAFTLMRSYARAHSEKLADIARAITEGTLNIAEPH